MRFNFLAHVRANDVAILLTTAIVTSSLFMAILACAGTPEPRIVEVETEIIKEVPVEIIKEVVVEVPVEVVKEVEVIKEVVKEVPVEVVVEKEVIKEVEVPVEVVVVKEVVKEVEVPVEVIKEVIVEKEVVKTQTPIPTSTPAPTPTPDSDRAALMALYNATDGDSWKNNVRWNTDLPLDQWNGVNTNRTGRVTKLDLRSNNLRGSIPPELGNLAYLTELYLYSNKLTGPIPPELGNLTKLVTLHLEQNKLNGSIPPELGNLTKLVTLRLEQNKLNGSIPPELDNLTILSRLSLYGNPLIGPIPPGIDQFARSENIRISLMDDRAALVALYDATDGDSWKNNVRWNTDLPLDQWNGVNTNRTGRVTKLDLRSNNLRGSIPPELGNLAYLTELYLYSNKLTGPIPPELGNLTKLVTLHLEQNKLNGSIPPELGNLTKLVTLRLEQNKLNGSIPPELDNLTILSRLSLYGNPLIGPIPPGIDQFARSENIRISLMDDRAALVALYDATDGDSWKNNVRWNTDLPLDQWNGVNTNRTGRVTKLDLRSNNLRGSIPPELGNLAYLVTLYLINNYIESYSVPFELAKLIACELTNNENGVLICSN